MSSVTSEWMKVMLDEIARKKAEAAETAAEIERRRDAAATGAVPESSRKDVPAAGV